MPDLDACHLPAPTVPSEAVVLSHTQRDEVLEKVTANLRPTTHVFQSYGYGNMPLSTPPFTINGAGSVENVIGGVPVSSVLCCPTLLCLLVCVRACHVYA